VRTNIVLDEKLVEEVQTLSHIKTRRELIDKALREFVLHRKRLDLREIKGSKNLQEDYDYKSTRINGE